MMRKVVEKLQAIQLREDYQGCISIRYHNADIARHLHVLAKAAFALNK